VTIKSCVIIIRITFTFAPPVAVQRIVVLCLNSSIYL
jgi:hypothetical protein